MIDRVEELTERPITVVHIVGGGTQNRLLNQFTANAIGRPVVTGPVEATAIGNILIQMLAVGHINSLNEGRDIVRRSFPVETCQPEDSGAWTEAYQRLLGLIEAEPGKAGAVNVLPSPSSHIRHSTVVGLSLCRNKVGCTRVYLHRTVYLAQLTRSLRKPFKIDFFITFHLTFVPFLFT